MTHVRGSQPWPLGWGIFVRRQIQPQQGLSKFSLPPYPTKKNIVLSFMRLCKEI